MSPTSIDFLFCRGSATLLIPTSITMAFSFTYVSSIISGHPTAAINISAFLQCSFKYLVFECVRVTVQSEDNKRDAIGFPTILDLPTITAFFPLKCFNSFLSIYRQPRGVHGTKLGTPI